MKKSFLSCSLVLLLSGAVLLPTALAKSSGEEELVVSLGEMDAFWRSRPVIGRWLTAELGLMAIPDYMTAEGLSFPYAKKDADREVPFADHLFVVRLLGGWRFQEGHGESGGSREADLVYREDGEMKYRWELMDARLDHYVDRGYDLTIVLDNIPWAFAPVPSEGPYGQTSPPVDWAKWRTFLGELARRLEQRYGTKRANGFRFRVGTENERRDRFNGTQEEYLQYYDHSARAIKEILPGAEVGPFNTSGGHYVSAMDNVSHHALADHAAQGVNHATGEIGSPFDWMAYSCYMMGDAFRDGRVVTADPEAKIIQRRAHWDKIARTHPKFADLPRELQEFGVLGGVDEGPRTAAWAFHLLMGLREAGLARSSSWSTFDSTSAGENNQLLQGEGWLYSILEHTVGSEAYVLSVTTDPSTRAVDEGVGFGEPELLRQAEERGLAKAHQTLHKAVAFAMDDRLYLVVSAFNEDRFVTQPQDVTITIPSSILPFNGDLVVETTSLTRENCPHHAIREALEEAGLLRPRYSENPFRVGTIRQMAVGFEGRKMIDDNFETYARMIRENLTLKELDGEVQMQNNKVKITTTMTPSSVQVFRLTPRG